MIGVCRLPAWIAATLVPFALSVAMAQAQTSYPDHPVKIIVPIAAGGSYDLVGRLLADALSKRTGQAFFVENKPGAGTVVGTQAAAQSEPDGHTLLIGGLAVLSSRRSPLAPDVPTMSEAGVPGLDIDSWLGIFAPAKTPPEAIARLRRDIRASLPDLRERFEKSGGEVWDLPDDRLDAFVVSEYDNWTKLIRETGIKLD
jgi:tripartite-type tricarboxylate transporter receptor subunit TctC